MKQESKDVILKVITEWVQYEVRANWDVCGDDLIRYFTNILRNMGFTSPTIVGALRNAADEIENDIIDMALYKDKDENKLDYGTTN